MLRSRFHFSQNTDMFSHPDWRAPGCWIMQLDSEKSILLPDMSKIYSPEELNSFSKEILIAVILCMQDQLRANMELLIEQTTDANNKRYGRSSEKLDVIAGQLELILMKQKH